ncbi:SOS response-associated peptidase [Chloroflexota bacterium]
MCYNISITPKALDLQVRFGATFANLESFEPVYSVNAFSFPELPVISNEDKERIQYYRWGLIPSWVKNVASSHTIRQQTLNARAETIFEKPSFRHSIRSKRCLILADGFFEWKHEKRATYTYYIRLTDHSAFAIAGIWDSWTNPETGTVVRTCSVITTAANSLLEKVHNTKKRMPVILKKEYEDKWLEETLMDEQIHSLLLPYNADEMEAYTVKKGFNNLGFNVTNSDVTKQHVFPELVKLN